MLRSQEALFIQHLAVHSIWDLGYILVYDLYTPKAVAHLLYQLHFHQCQQIQQMLLSLTYYYYIVATTIRTTCMDNSKTTTKITTTLFDLLYSQIILYMITTFYDIAITS